MPDDSKDSRYDETRRQFDDLAPEEQARFLLEATAATLADGIEHVGRTLAEGLQDTLRQARRRTRETPSAGPGAAEPETSQRQRPRNGASASDDT